MSLSRNLCAKDIMTHQVLMAYEGWSIQRLIEFFSKHSISGAPVIASDHALVGVVSVTDIINFAGSTDEIKTNLLKEVYSEFVGYEFDEAFTQSVASEAAKQCTVNQIMTKDILRIDEKTRIAAIATLMLDNEVRRIFVTKNGIISGVISTSNMLKAINQIEMI